MSESNKNFMERFNERYEDWLRANSPLGRKIGQTNLISSLDQIEHEPSLVWYRQEKNWRL